MTVESSCAPASGSVRTAFGLPPEFATSALRVVQRGCVEMSAVLLCRASERTRHVTGSLLRASWPQVARRASCEPARRDHRSCGPQPRFRSICSKACVRNHARRHHGSGSVAKCGIARRGRAEGVTRLHGWAVPPAVACPCGRSRSWSMRSRCWRGLGRARRASTSRCSVAAPRSWHPRTSQHAS